MKLITGNVLLLFICFFLGLSFFAEYLGLTPVMTLAAICIGLVLMMIRIFRGDD